MPVRAIAFNGTELRASAVTPANRSLRVEVTSCKGPYSRFRVTTGDESRKVDAVIFYRPA